MPKVPTIREEKLDGESLSTACASRTEALAWLFGRTRVYPAEPSSNGNGAAHNGRKTDEDDEEDEGVDLECLPCESYKLLLRSWRKALRWTDGLDHALTVMLASVASTKVIGDQLWVKVIGPAACGKSTLCEALSVNREHVLAKSTIRGFHSGYRLDDGGEKEQDHSLINQLYDKTLVTKDGDTLLQSPNLQQILSEARDLYDSTSRTHYRNAMSKDYSGVRMTWLLCGTSSLRQIDQSELGERFLDCVIMEKIDSDLEDEILWRVVNRAAKNLTRQTNGKAISQYEPELAQAMQLTGGYIDWLRENGPDVMAEIRFPDWAKRRCMSLGKFVAYMRARPSYRQEEVAEREFGTRLVSQLMRLAGCLALVLNHDTVDEEIMKRTKRVALDTSRGQTLDMVAVLYDAGQLGLEVRTISMYCNRPDTHVKPILRFLKRIEVVEHYQYKKTKGLSGKQRWRLTETIRNLYATVMEINDGS